MLLPACLLLFPQALFLGGCQLDTEGWASVNQLDRFPALKEVRGLGGMLLSMR